MAKILLGPIVGLVTSTTTRVLLEVDSVSTVSVSLFNDIACFKVELELPAEGARAFHFQELIPDTFYRIRIEGASSDVCPDGSVHTLPNDPEQIRVYALSCDRLEFESKTDMWEILNNRLDRGRFNLILHLGDNVYMDTEAKKTGCSTCTSGSSSTEVPPYRKAELLLGKDPSSWDSHKEEILGIFRKRYRSTWGRRAKAAILATASNIMILDDHEVRDDLGDIPEDSDEKSKTFFVNNLALQVYHEYQRQLWDPNILSESYQKTLNNEFFALHIGPLSLAMLDARTPRAMYRCRRQPNDHSFYGNEQREEMKNLFSKDSQTRMWLIGSSIPLVFFTRKCSRRLIKLLPSNDDLKVFLDRKLSDVEELLDLFREWKESRGLEADLLVLAGDVHVGNFTDIKYKDEDFVCRQITTSPICNKNWRPIQYTIGVTSLLNCFDRESRYEYKHYDIVNSCNFIELDLDFRSSRMMHYDVSMAQENGPDIKCGSTCEPTQQSHDYIRNFFRSCFCAKS